MMSKLFTVLSILLLLAKNLNYLMNSFSWCSQVFKTNVALVYTFTILNYFIL